MKNKTSRKSSATTASPSPSGPAAGSSLISSPASGATAPRWTDRVQRDLAALDPADCMNALPRLLCDWLHDEQWIAAASAVPSVDRCAELARAGRSAFDQDWGGYATFLRKTAAGLDYIWPPDEREEIFRQHMQLLLVNISDILDFRSAQRATVWDHVTITGDQHVRAALEAGRGLMALSVHQSHPAFGFMHPAWNGVGISTVARLGDRDAPQSSLLLDGLRDRVEILPTTPAALRPMLGRLASGGCVAIYCDYLYPGTPGTLSMLLGGPVFVASAAVSVALRTGTAVIPVSVARCWPPEEGRVQVQFGAPLPLADLDPRDPASHDAAALRFGIAMELMIRRHPSVWRLWPALRYRWRSTAKSIEQRAAEAAAAAPRGPA